MLLAMGINWIALLGFPSDATHWTLRARKLYPIRRSAARPEAPATLYWTSGLMYLILVILFAVMVTMD